MQERDIALPAPASSGQGGRGITLLAAALACLVLAPWVARQDFYLHLAVLVCINIVITSGLSVLMRCGQVSLCHGAFVGLGAYAATLATMQLGLPFAAGVLCAMLLTAALALVLGAVMLRLTGVYFVLITFAFGELVRLGLLEWEGLTGGANGITGVPPAELLGMALDTKAAFYGLAAGIALLSVAGLWRLFGSPAGHTIDAVGENAALAEASGLSVRRAQLFAFVVASAMAGLGGALLAHYVGYISPESFTFSVSVGAIIMLVVGGRAYILGPVIGALVMTPLPEFFRGAVQSQNIFYGCAVILMLRFMPQGLAGLAGLAARRGTHEGGAR